MALAHSPSIVTDGLVLCLDAGNPKSYPGSGTTWTDLSSNGNTGTLVNGVGYNSGNLGSLSFDGVNDYVGCGSGIDSTISFGQGKSFTLEVFFETNDYTTLQSIIARRNIDGSGSTDYMIFYQGSNLIFGTGISSDIGAWRNLGTAFTYNNQIMHFCGVVNSTGDETGTKITYKNGVQIDSVSYTKKASPTANQTFIGKVNGDSLYFNGKIYSTKIYNRALTASEIQQNYNALKSRFQ